MKILSKYRLIAKKPNAITVDEAYELFMLNSRKADKLMYQHNIYRNDLINFIYKNNVLELLIEYWIKKMQGFTGNLAYELEYYGGNPIREYYGGNPIGNKKRTPIGFINWLNEYGQFIVVQNVQDILQQKYFNLAKTKYRKFVYPVLNTNYLQVFPEFKYFNVRSPEAVKAIKIGKYTPLEDYVKSTGFR